MAKRKSTTSEETIAKSWEVYNKLIDEQIDKAEYKKQQASNRYYAEKTTKKYRGKENIARQLFRKSKVWTKTIISRYAKEIGLSTSEAKYGLSKLSRQQLFDTFLELSGKDYDIAAANYRSIVYGENIDIAKVKEARENG